MAYGTAETLKSPPERWRSTGEESHANVIFSQGLGFEAHLWYGYFCRFHCHTEACDNQHHHALEGDSRLRKTVKRWSLLYYY